ELAEGVQGKGEITSRGGRDRVDGAEVTVFTSSGARHTKSDAEGAFHLDDLAPGRARIVARKDGLASAELVVTVTGDRDHAADFGAIDLPEAGEVEGQVVDAHDDGVAGARVAKGGAPTDS